jgi:hypothetical protein
LATLTRFRGTGFRGFRDIVRVACDDLRLSREEVFDAFRLMPAALFLVR